MTHGGFGQLDHVRRLAVYMPTWVGDVVMATPALRTLRMRFSESHITLVIRSNTRDVLSDAPFFDELYELPAGRGAVASIQSMAAAVRWLRRRRLDAVVLLSNSFRSALTMRFTGVARRLGYDRDGRGWLLTDRMAPLRAADGRLARISTVHYYNDLVIRLGCDDPGERYELGTDPRDDTAIERRLADAGIPRERLRVVINPGASFGPSKLWLTERYAQVADRLVTAHDAAIIITCGPGEEHLAGQVQKAMKCSCLVLDNPRLTLRQLKSLIRGCDLLLNNDTGPRHFAKAFDTPVVTVFGSTDPAWTDTDYAHERRVRIAVDCGPCQKKVCPLGHHDCMTGVSAEMVYDAAVELLQFSAGSAMRIPIHAGRSQGDD